MQKDKEIEKFSENKHASEEIKNYNVLEMEHYQVGFFFIHKNFFLLKQILFNPGKA